MIYSKLENNENLSVYPPAIQKALEWLKNTDLYSLESGRYKIEGDKIVANVGYMTTHPFEGSHPEVHKRYVDLMYWPEGREKIGFAPHLGTEPVFDEYPSNDIKLLTNVKNENFIVASEGCFAVFFPWDAHRPALMLGDFPANSRKVTIKISIDCLAE